MEDNIKEATFIISGNGSTEKLLKVFIKHKLYEDDIERKIWVILGD